MCRRVVSMVGLLAVDIEQPVRDVQGSLTGAVSILIRPELFLGETIRPVLHGLPIKACVMETSGRILYDADPLQIGKLLFADTMFRGYRALRDLGARMAAEEQGQGVYTFRDLDRQRETLKDAYWTTLRLHATPWRLMLI